MLTRHTGIAKGERDYIFHALEVTLSFCQFIQRCFNRRMPCLYPQWRACKKYHFSSPVFDRMLTDLYVLRICSCQLSIFIKCANWLTSTSQWKIVENQWYSTHQSISVQHKQRILFHVSVNIQQCRYVFEIIPLCAICASPLSVKNFVTNVCIDLFVLKLSAWKK